MKKAKEIDGYRKKYEYGSDAECNITDDDSVTSQDVDLYDGKDDPMMIRCHPSVVFSVELLYISTHLFFLNRWQALEFKSDLLCVAQFRIPKVKRLINWNEGLSRRKDLSE